MWFLKCFFILGFFFQFPWCVPAPEGRVNGGSVTCSFQLLFSPSFYSSSIGRMILNEGIFFNTLFPSLPAFLLSHVVLIFSVTQTWIWLSFVSSFIPSSPSVSGRLSHSPPLGTGSISVLSPKSQVLACVPSPLPTLEPERLSLKAESWLCTAPQVSSGLPGLSSW